MCSLWVRRLRRSLSRIHKFRILIFLWKCVLLGSGDYVAACLVSIKVGWAQLTHISRPLRMYIKTRWK
jgi:hypothetical protein